VTVARNLLLEKAVATGFGADRQAENWALAAGKVETSIAFADLAAMARISMRGFPLLFGLQRQRQVVTLKDHPFDESFAQFLPVP
jgi:hypothetical protein